MALIRHNLPLFITLAVLFFVIGFIVGGAFLWHRVGVLRAALFGALILWGGLLLAFALTPKRRYQGELALPRSCTVTVLPSHLLGAVTNVQRLEIVLLFVPLAALVVLAARGLNRVVLGMGLAVLPFAIEAVQYALPGLRKTCASNDVYDSWSGLVLGFGIGAGALVLTRRSKLAQARLARHRQLGQGPPHPLDVVRVLWPPLEAAEVKTPVTPRSTFVPSGAKPGVRPAPQSARQVRRERAHQEREERRAHQDRRAEQERRGRHSSKGGSETAFPAERRRLVGRRAKVRRATDRGPSAPD
ncbi:MAG: hypothetical protein M3P23_00500 [Actinomycetota bacterium]|nr:hypothetical protein [Actinomycetota bacterium]